MQPAAEGQERVSIQDQGTTAADMLRRIEAVHELWQRGVADLTLEQVNHAEREGVLPIAFTLLHYVRGEDANATALLDAGPMLWDEHAPRLGHEGVVPQRGTPVADAARVRLSDVDAWRAYQTAVFARTERALAALSAERLEELAFGGERPAGLAGGFLGAYVREGPVRRREAVEAFVFQHASRHLGELEHARALVGLGGLS